MVDTNFFIRLLNDEEALHSNAVGYFEYFPENEVNYPIAKDKWASGFTDLCFCKEVLFRSPPV